MQLPLQPWHLQPSGLLVLLLSHLWRRALINFVTLLLFAHCGIAAMQAALVSASAIAASSCKGSCAQTHRLHCHYLAYTQLL